MNKSQVEPPRFEHVSVAGQPGLPAGVRQADCDGVTGDLDDASGNGLWSACDAAQQESISGRFVALHADRLRDTLLDVEDGVGHSRDLAAVGALLGQLLWPVWIGYRDRALRELHGRGELSCRRASPSLI
jgi:hypothetical protein